MVFGRVFGMGWWLGVALLGVQEKGALFGG